ncbi:ABC transporter ATP-binding protein [Roseibacillus ishigakijimensis]|uniref:ABC transporter ATP-binding protein n=1 Tax=Roseibacillus ishigakijimensis TaxID=454146 RepID=A0A934RLH3_9BACT|nr:ABC transporter ATP-binding protein [Roseibacillus ishigakijimensis]MBK1833594.1 ABC transporter ATP-binding protein [Roseibacillus ishigakijimensis]
MKDTTQPPPLRVSSVTKLFGKDKTRVRALDQIDLTIQPGEFVAIMGASGSGKSTLLNVMAGLTDIDGGQVEVEGKELASLNDSELTLFRRDRIGLVFQNFNLIPVLTASDNIKLPAADENDLAQRTDDLLARLGLSDRRHHKPDALSGGEQQRVAIARALINDPAIILADEPTGSLDSVSGQDFCRLLHELCQNDGRTIVVVTHEPTVAMWADRVVVLQDGRAINSFPVEERDPQTISLGYQQALNASSAS